MFYLAQAGTSLYRLDATGAATLLTPPADVLLDASRRARFAVLNRQVVIVNSPSDNLWVDPQGTVRRLTMKPPATPVVLAAGAAGTLNGSYIAACSFVVRDVQTRRVLAESPMGPISAASPTLANQVLSVTQVPLAAESIESRRLYRTSSGPGDTYFRWIDLDQNEQTTLIDGVSDESLDLFAAPTDLGASPRFELIVEWKDRLWAKPMNEIDSVYYTGVGKFYGWPWSQRLAVKPLGGDERGVTGFMARRDELAIGRLDRIYKVVGTSPTNYELPKLIEGVGIVAPDSVNVRNDIARWLAKDGVYEWGPNGVTCISKERVHPWFATDTYFNRSEFPNAIGRYNPRFNTYELLLAAAGSSVLDRWVSYDLDRKIWLGPHRTAVCTPTATGLVLDENDLDVPMIGASDGHLYRMNQTGASDGASAIDYDVILRHAQDPDVQKVFGELSLLTRPTAGTAGRLTITPYVGPIDPPAQAPFTHELAHERETHRHLGVGRVLKLRFRQNVAGQACEILGYEIPLIRLGVR
jgi:hypothetical protein